MFFFLLSLGNRADIGSRAESVHSRLSTAASYEKPIVDEVQLA